MDPDAGKNTTLCVTAAGRFFLGADTGPDMDSDMDWDMDSDTGLDDRHAGAGPAGRPAHRVGAPHRAFGPGCRAGPKDSGAHVRRIGDFIFN